MKQRILSVLLALTMLLSLMPAAVFAVEEKTEEDIIWVTHEGIGSIEDSFPLSGTYGLTSGLTYDGSYYEQLDQNSKKVYDAIYADGSPLKAGPVKYVKDDSQTYVSLNIPCTNKNDAQDIISAALAALVYDHPELSWLVNTQWSYGYTTTTNGSMTAITNFKLSDQGYEDATTPYTEGNYGHADTKDRAAITAAITKAKNEIGPLSNTTEYEKIKAIHDWVCKNMKYTDQSSAKFKNSWRGFQTAYSALVEGDTVCAGYSKSFKLLCDEYRIPCATVSGTGGGGPHAWNYVQCEGKWYGVDCTWDDNDNETDPLNYSFFLKGSSNFNGNGYGNTHKEGTLYNVYQFAYPTLETGDYKLSGSPDSIEITYSPDHTATSDNNVPGFAVPVIERLDTPTENTITLTAAMTGGNPQKVEWSLSSNDAGIALTPGENDTATLTIKNFAAKEKNPNSQTSLTGPIITVTAMCGTTSASKDLWIYVRYRIPKFVQIPEGGKTLSPGGTAAYTAKVYDQYGQEMSGQAVTWTVAPAATGVTVNNGTVSVSSDATQGSYTVTASAGSASTSVTVTVEARHSHDYTTWANDGDQHWKVCSCGAIGTKSAHSWGTGTETKPASHSEDGVRTYTCECGKTKTEPIPKHEVDTSKWTSDNSGHWHACKQSDCTVKTDFATHQDDAGTTTKEPTCAETGEKIFKCTVCGAQTRTETLSKTENHKWDEGTVTKAPTCTEAGVKTFTCSVCQATKTEEVPATGHEWSTDWAKDNTHHWHNCTASNCPVTENSKKGGYAEHTWNDGTVTTAPTCTTKGVKTFTCTVCQQTKTEEISTIDHTWSNKWLKDDIHHWHACTNSSCTAISEKIPHTWDEGVETTPATYAAPGVKTFTCTACGQTKTEAIAQLEHKYSDQWSKDGTYHWHACTDAGFENLRQDEAPHTWTKNDEKSTAATTEADGKNVYDCTCGAEKEEIIGATGHNYSEEWTSNKTEHWHACTDEGCDKVSGKAPHSWTVKTTTAATHTQDGAQVLECVCGETKNEPLPKHTVSPLWSGDADKHWHACTESTCTVKDSEADHVWDEGTVTTPATFDAPGVKTITCTVCAQKKTETIAQLTHTYSSAWSTDAEYHWHACTDTGYDALVKDKAPHVYDDAEDTGCNTCGYTRTVAPPPHAHTWDTAWSKDASGHWHACTSSTCTGKDSFAAHVYTDDADTTCNTCGYTRTIAPPAPGHTHAWAAAWSSDPTHHWHDCTASGCDVTANSGKSGYAAHAPSDWITDKAATSTAAGSRHKECTVCGYTTATESIPATGGSSSGGSDSSSSDSSSTTRNPDGSTTTTTTRSDGTTVETTSKKDGTREVVETRKDGTVITTETAKNGDKVVTTENKDGSVREVVTNKDGSSATVTTSASGDVEADVTVKPVNGSAAAPISPVRVGDNEVVVTIKTSASDTTRVQVPVSNISSGVVAVLVKADGTEEVIRTSVPTANGLLVPVKDGETVKIEDRTRPFHDMGGTAWAQSAVDFVSARGMFAGTSESTFSPDSDLTRGQMVTVLARYQGVDTNGGSTWYEKGVQWAMAAGVSDGTAPESQISREQMVAMIWRAAGRPEVKDTSRFQSFRDAGSVAEYAREAMAWAIENGIISGVDASTISPRGTATRAQVAAVLARYVQNIEAQK